MYAVHNRTHANGQATPGGNTGQQKRALRRLLRDFVIVTGAAANDLAAATPRKAPQSKRQRLLYRRAVLTDADLDVLVADIGIERWWAAAERATQPQLPLVAAE